MTRRALIIGSQVEGLTGVYTDINAIKLALEARGFQAEVRVDADATREGILKGYRKLIAESASDDAAVVYYSGHGGRAINPHYDPEGLQPKYLQFIVPTDYNVGGFHGIRDWELSELQAQLTAKTRNVAIILDCCYAARMSRRMELAPTEIRARALPRLWTEGIEEHLQQVAPTATATLYAESNSYAVRLVATEADKSAYEYRRADGSVGGAMTESLVLVLKEAGELPVSWHALGMRVREHVLSLFPEQRPEIEGPSQRFLFDTKEAERTGAVAFFYDHDVPSLRAGRLLGSAVGAEYGIMPLETSGFDAAREAARATVTVVEGSVSRVRLDMRGAKTNLADGALAFPVKVPFEKRRVFVSGAGTKASALRVAINESKHLQVADEEANTIGTVRCDGETVQIFDPFQVALTEPQPADAASQRQIIATLNNLARGDALRKLESGGLEADIRVTWGRVVDNRPVFMAEGDTFHIGDRLFVKLENAGETPVYAAVFDIDIGGSISLLTNAEPNGTKIEPRGGIYCLGKKGEILTGLGSEWKKGVPNDGPRQGSLVVIVADERQEFRALEIDLHGTARGGRGLISGLEQLLEHFRSGNKRTFLSEIDQTGSGKYLVQNINFQVDPRPRPVSGRRASFVIDESPSATCGAQQRMSQQMSQSGSPFA